MLDLMQPEVITQVLVAAGTIVGAEALKTAAQAGTTNILKALDALRKHVTDAWGQNHPVTPAIEAVLLAPQNTANQQALTDALDRHLNKVQLEQLQSVLEQLQAEVKKLQPTVTFNNHAPNHGLQIGTVEGHAHVIQTGTYVGTQNNYSKPDT